MVITVAVFPYSVVGITIFFSDQFHCNKAIIHRIVMNGMNVALMKVQNEGKVSKGRV